MSAFELNQDGLKVRCLSCGSADFESSVEEARRSITLGSSAGDVVITLLAFLCPQCQGAAPEAVFVTATRFVAAYCGKALVIE